MGPQPPKGTAATGKTRQGRWGLKNQVGSLLDVQYASAPIATNSAAAVEVGGTAPLSACV